MIRRTGLRTLGQVDRAQNDVADRGEHQTGDTRDRADSATWIPEEDTYRLVEQDPLNLLVELLAGSLIRFGLCLRGQIDDLIVAQPQAGFGARRGVERVDDVVRIAVVPGPVIQERADFAFRVERIEELGVLERNQIDRHSYLGQIGLDELTQNRPEGIRAVVEIERQLGYARFGDQ